MLIASFPWVHSCQIFSIPVQSIVDAGRQGDDDPNSSVVSETMKFLPNSSYGYQIKNRSRHSVIRNMNDQNTHAVTNN